VRVAPSLVIGFVLVILLTSNPAGASIQPARSLSPPFLAASLISGTWVNSSCGSPHPAAPHTALFDPANGFVYVSDGGSGNVTILNGTRLVGAVDDGLLSGPGPGTYAPPGGLVYVPNANANNVSIINGTRWVGAVGVGSSPSGSVYDHRNGFVYVTNGGSRNVSILHGMSLIPFLGFVNVGSSPQSPTFDDKNGFVYVPNFGSSNVSVLNGTVVTASFFLGSNTAPTAAAFDSSNGFVYVASSRGSSSPGNLSVLNGTALVSSVTVGDSPGSPAFDRANGYVYVPNEGSGNVSVINGTHLVATISLGAGSGPVSATYDPRNGFVYVTDALAGTTSILNGTTLYWSAAVGQDPAIPAVDAAHGLADVPNAGSASVTFLRGTTSVGSVDIATPAGSGNVSTGGVSLSMRMWGACGIATGAAVEGLSVPFVAHHAGNRTLSVTWGLNWTASAQGYHYTRCYGRPPHCFTTNEYGRMTASVYLVVVDLTSHVAKGSPQSPVTLVQLVTNGTRAVVPGPRTLVINETWSLVLGHSYVVQTWVRASFNDDAGFTSSAFHMDGPHQGTLMLVSIR
jgi:DNA-binding beta-propeller fold protein YncE